MIELNVSKLKAGMILAEPVHNHQELLILDAGVKIAEKHIRIFKSWGVVSVCVKGDDVAPKNKQSADGDRSPAAIDIDLREKFSEVLDDPVMLEIMRAASSILSKSVDDNNEEI
jgi:hypothetical protein